MTDDELLLIYKNFLDMTEAMKAREVALDAKTAALGAAIAQLGKLPETLGKQTSQYIAMGVRQSIQDDFSRPIADAVKGPIAELSRETYHARSVIAEVARYERFHTWTWLGIIFLLGCLAGGTAGYYLVVCDLNSINAQLGAIQQQITPPAPTPDAKPGDGKAAKGKKGHLN
jgi:hypothetical protein